MMVAAEDTEFTEMLNQGSLLFFSVISVFSVANPNLR
jgi:hypothetical protein